MKIRSVLSYAVSFGLLILIVVMILRDPNAEQMIRRLSLGDMVESLLISTIIYVISGWQISYLMNRSNGKKLNTLDLIILPASMNLWSYILPFRGGLIYSMFFIRMKYGVQLMQGFSMGLFTFLMSMNIAGLFGIVFAFKYNMIFSVFFVVSLFLVLSSILLWWSRGVFSRIAKRGHPAFLMRLVHMISDMISGFGAYLRDGRALFSIITSVLLSIFVYIVWVFCAVKSLGINLNDMNVVALAFVLRLSVIARFLPGNIGIQELISGVALEGMGGDLNAGVMIALFIRITALSLAVIFGIYGFFANFAHFKTLSFIELWQKFRAY